jgi:alpha-galactosidase
MAVIRYHIEGEEETFILREPGRTVSSHGMRITWRWQEAEGVYKIWVRLTHRGKTPVYLDSVDVLRAPLPDLGTPPEKWAIYQHHWGSWAPVFARHLDKNSYSDPGTLEYRRMHQPHFGSDEGVIASEWVTVIASRLQDKEQTNSVMVGFVTMAEQLSELRIRTDGSELIARCYFDGRLLAPGDSVGTEEVILSAGADPLALLELWAEEAGQSMKARVPDSMPTGWCTWYYYYGENTAEDVLDNVKAIDDHRLPLDVILLDDGYQTAIGDWFSIDEEKFPDGLAALSKEIRDTGHTFGVWTAPFGAAEDSELYAAHPGWFLQDETGKPVVAWNHWGKDCYALDCTHPEVLDWLRETFKRMRSEWKASFFKIDFLFAAASRGRRQDPNTTRAQALRQGLEAIRKGIGSKSFLLGCGAPMGPSIGIVNGMRVGPDVDPNWHPIMEDDLAMPATENALRNAITRAPFHCDLWANDPDCLLVREQGPDMDLQLNEVHSLVSLVALLGGLTFNSDNVTALDEERIDLLRQTLPPTGTSARPIDLFEHEMPRILLLPAEREWGRWWILGLINWEEETTTTRVQLEDLGLPPGLYHAYHYWQRRYLGSVGRSITLEDHEPHETIVLLLKPVTEEPQLLTTTFHVCQGMVEIAEYEMEILGSEAELGLTLEKRGRQSGQVLFTTPGDWRAVEAWVDGEEVSLQRAGAGVVALTLTLEDRAEIEVTFRKAV